MTEGEAARAARGAGVGVGADPEGESPQRGRDPWRPELLALDVTLAYREAGGAFHALHDVRLGLRGPACVAIAGPSGSGKSSLLYVLAGLKRPTAGRVLFAGRELTGMPVPALCALRRRHFGFVFQQPFLIQYLTAAENVAVGAARADREACRQAERMLARLGMRGLAGRRPHELSGGQRQRVAAARALMHEPAVVFADEPTASLDRATGAELVALLQEYRRAKGALLALVTHDEAIAARADAVVRMTDGRVAGIEVPAPAGPGAPEGPPSPAPARRRCRMP